MTQTEPRIVDYGPRRLIGVGRVSKTPQDCVEAWEDDNGFLKRMAEIEPAEDETSYYGVCRCVEGAEPGAFEYIAAMPAADGSPVPQGMTEIVIPAGGYAEFAVASLSDIGRVWGYTGEWLSAHPEWKGFCDGAPNGCGCIATPAFELYPPGFDGTGGLFIYMPIQPA